MDFINNFDLKLYTIDTGLQPDELVTYLNNARDYWNREGEYIYKDTRAGNLGSETEQDFARKVNFKQFLTNRMFNEIIRIMADYLHEYFLTNSCHSEIIIMSEEKEVFRVTFIDESE